MASRLHDYINSYTLERGIEFDQAYTTTPTRTGSNTSGTFSLSGTTPVYQSTVGPKGGSGSWQLKSPRTSTPSGASNFRVSSGANTTDLATFSDNDWAIGIWFNLNNKITSQYNTENEIEFLSCGAFRLAYSSSTYSTPNRFMYSMDGSGYSTFQQTGHTAVEANRWYYLAVRRVGTSVTFYLDGVSVRTLTWSATITPSDLRFGSGNTIGSLASGDMTWNISNFHYGTSTNLTEGVIQSIWGVGSTSQAWNTAIVAESPSPKFWTRFDQALGNPSSLTNSGSLTFNDINGTRYGPASGATISNGGKVNQEISFVGDNASTGRTYYKFASTNNYIFELDDGAWSIEWWSKGYTTYGGKNPTIWAIRGSTTSNYVQAWVAGVGQSNEGKLQVQIVGASNNSLVSSSQAPSDGTWHHYAVTYNSAANEWKLYIDGSLDASAAAPNMGSQTSTFINIGTDYAAANANMFNGSLDEFIIWEQTLTSTDVSDHYNSTLPPAISVDYTNTTGATASADFVMPAFDVSSPIDVAADPSTASADSVTPTLSLDTIADAFGVATASADSVTPTIQVESNISYSAAPATASATSPDATVTTSKTVSYSAAPATVSALLGGNVYAGPTVQDSTYHVYIRQIGESTNTDGKNGFSIGSQYTNSTLDSRTSVAFKALSGIPTSGTIIKVKFDSGQVTASTSNDAKEINEYNVYVFTANPSTTFDTMNYSNLPAKTLLYKTRSSDADGRYLDLTPAFRDTNAATYGIFVEHVGEPPYSGTVYDRVEYSGTNLEDKLFYVLTSEFVSVNYNVPANTASADIVNPSVAAQKYVDYSHSAATASADIVNATAVGENNITAEAMVTTASALAVQPGFSGGITYVSDHLEAHSDMLAFVVTVTRNVTIAVDPSTLSAELHMPQAQVGEDNLVDHMDASAEFVMPTVIIPDTNAADIMTASADIVQPAINGELLGVVSAGAMTASAFLVEETTSFNLTNDPYYARLNTFHNDQPGSPAYPFIKWMRQPANLGTGSTFNADRTYGSVELKAFTSYTPWTNISTPALETGYFDNLYRKAVRFNNIAYTWPAAANSGTPSIVRNNGAWSFEMMFKTSKQNQELLYDFRTSPFNQNANSVFRIGLNQGKFYTIWAQVGTTGNPEHNVVPWNATYGKGSSYYVEGFKNIADGEWHHVVIQSSGSNDRFQVWIDGELDFQRYNRVALWPGTIGGNSWDSRGTADFYMSTMSLLPNVFLSERNIKLNYYKAFGYSTIEAEPMTATTLMTDDNGARGNRPRALALYWWPQQRTAAAAQETDNFDKYQLEFDYPTFFTTIDTYQTKSQQLYGWDVYAVDVTGTYYSEVVNRTSYSGDITTVTPGIGQPYTISTRGFRDPVTDNRRYLDVFNDIDLDQVEAIFFINYPNESRERDVLIRDESVDDYFNIKEKELYEEFIVGLRKAVDTGVSLMVSNSQLAIDLGIVDRVEVIDPLIDGITYSSAGQINISADDWNNDKDRATALVPLSSGKLDSTRGNWADFASNNRIRIVNTISGITDLMYFTLQDQALYNPNGLFAFGSPPELYTRVVYSADGATVGTTFIMPDQSDPFDKSNTQDFARRYLAVPFENVKAGTIVAAFANNYKKNNIVTDNPYANYATHIALEAGTTLNGTALGGRIWVTLTERPQESTGSYAEVELSTDYWINLAYQLGLIDENDKDTNLNRIQNLDRQLEAGEITQEFYNQATYWSELGYNQTTQVSSSLRGSIDQAVAGLGKLFAAIFAGEEAGKSDESRLKLSERLFSYSSTGITAQVQNYYTEPKVIFPTVSLNQAAFGWLANKQSLEGKVVRDIAGTASAVMINPVVVGDKNTTNNAQAMLANATQADPTNYTWTQKDINIVSLPMLATATITPRLTLISANAMTATADMRQDISAYVAQIDEVVLYINHVDPILYLREDIVK